MGTSLGTSTLQSLSILGCPFWTPTSWGALPSTFAASTGSGQDVHNLLQVALRWAGDANIAIAVELPAGGEATRMVPKVSDVRINAVARIKLAPLVGDMPGFGAAVVSLRYHQSPSGSLLVGSAPCRALNALFHLHKWGTPLWLDQLCSGEPFPQDFALYNPCGRC